MQIRVLKAGLTGVTAHKASHEPGGDDPLTGLTADSFAAEYKNGSAELPSLRSLGTAPGRALPGDHESVTNARTPVAHKASHLPGGSDEITAAAINVWTKTEADVRYPRTVNGVAPDETGNIVVDAEGVGATGVGSIEGVVPNAPGGNINLTSNDGTLEFIADNAGDGVDFSASPVLDALGVHAALAVDPADTNTDRTKHVSNDDLNKRALKAELEIPLGPWGFYGDLAVVTGLGRFPITRAGTITEVRAAVQTSPVGAPVTLSIKKNNTEVATLTIAAGAGTGNTTGLSIAVAVNDRISIDITGVGTTTKGANLTVTAMQRLS